MTEKITERVTVLLSPSEKKRLGELARNRGLSLSAFIRSSLTTLKN